MRKFLVFLLLLNTTSISYSANPEYNSETNVLSVSTIEIDGIPTFSDIELVFREDGLLEPISYKPYTHTLSTEPKIIYQNRVVEVPVETIIYETVYKTVYKDRVINSCEPPPEPIVITPDFREDFDGIVTHSTTDEYPVGSYLYWAMEFYISDTDGYGDPCIWTCYNIEIIKGFQAGETGYFYSDGFANGYFFDNFTISYDDAEPQRIGYYEDGLNQLTIEIY